MDTQQNFDLVVSLSSDDMTASFVPACFDDYLVLKKMSHTGSRPDTKSKMQSSYAM
jgi:hypothetical protein